MNKTLKILLLLIIFSFSITSFSYASNLVSEEATISSENVQGTNSTETDYLPNDNNFYYSGISNISTLSSYSEANLELNNILNILLIAIGILIILFAIAILIRLKH